MEAPGKSPGLWRGLVDDPKHGPLPAFLVVMTVTTGIVDAVSILSLGRVFVANMTGNIAFIGFALVGAKGFSLSASLFALGGFLLGALGGGWFIRKKQINRAQLLRDTLGVEFALLVIALIVAVAVSFPISRTGADAIAASLAIALGLQNSVVRRLAVPDLTTTVLTMTLTGIFADAPTTGNSKAVIRRILAVAALLVGALGGALLVIRVNPSAALGLAVFLFGVVFVASIAAATSVDDWQT